MENTANVEKKPSGLQRGLCTLLYLLSFGYYLLCDLLFLNRLSYVDGFTLEKLCGLLFYVMLPIILVIVFKKRENTFVNYHVIMVLLTIIVGILLGEYFWGIFALFGAGCALAGKQTGLFHILSPSNIKRFFSEKPKSTQSETSDDSKNGSQTKQTLSARDIINEQMKQK